MTLESCSGSRIMPDPEPLGIYWGNEAWFRANKFSWFPNTHFQNNRVWKFGNSEQVKLDKKITERVGMKPSWCERTGLVTAVYTAQYLKEQSNPQSVIVKIYMRIPNIPTTRTKRYITKSDLLSLNPPIVEDLQFNTCTAFSTEYTALQRLTNENCKSTPRHIAHFNSNKDNPWVKDGTLGFIVMERLPGVKVLDVWGTGSVDSKQRDRRNRIKQAFQKALFEVQSHGIFHQDPGARNLIWNEKESKCYLIDFEGSYYEEDFKAKTLADLAFIYDGDFNEVLDDWDSFD